MKLEEVAQVSIGVLASREISKVGENEYRIFNLKNYDAKEEYEEVHTLKNFDDKLTKEKDLLIRLVSPNRIVYIDETMENLLVPSQMCIIRPNRKKINSEFLKWYLESDMGKEKIMLNLTGSSIQKISVAALRKLEIPVLDLEKQNTITDLIKLWKKEKETLQNVIDQKDILYNALISEIIEKEG